MGVFHQQSDVKDGYTLIASKAVEPPGGANSPLQFMISLVYYTESDYFGLTSFRLVLPLVLLSLCL